MAEREEPRIVFAHSTRRWAQAVLFFLSDHGGAAVVGHALTADEALTAPADLIVVDDISSFLSRDLVTELHSSGKKLLGVFDPGDRDAGEERLREVGVDETIASDSPAELFLAVMVSLAGRPRRVVPHGTSAGASSRATPGLLVAVAAAAGGAGATEVALALATKLRSRHGATVVADVDDATPSLAQRRGLPTHPNLLTAIEAVRHGTGSLSDCLLEDARTGLRILGGLPGSHPHGELRPDDVVAVLRDAARRSEVLVANVACRSVGAEEARWTGRSGVLVPVIGMAHAVVIVAAASPIGVARLIDWLADFDRLLSGKDVHLVVNYVPRSGYRSVEIAAELHSFTSPASITLLPSDTRVTRAAWRSEPVGRGPFLRGVTRLARQIESVSAAM